jgi:uncharacterized protein
MEQLDFFDVPSPCVRRCTVDEKGYCIGCMRNRQERFNWLTMSTSEKLRVIKRCKMRYRRKISQGKKNQIESVVDESNPQPDFFD